MIEVVFLGTSASAPSVRRGLPSTMILHRDRRFLIDAGEGTQRQLLRSGLGFKRLDTVFLTHGHLDHILGLGGIASTFSRWEAADRLSIHGGRWALDRVRDLMDVVIRGAETDLVIDYQPLAPGPVLTAGDLDVVAFPVTHRGSGNFGFIFQEKSHRPFLVEQAEKLGVPAGPERRRLVQGHDVELEGGRVVRPDEVLGRAEPGTKLVFIGDVGRLDGLDVVARNADLLICEATYLWDDRDTARQFGHVTARDVAGLAREAGVHSLILTHVSRRYRPSEVAQEATAVFPNTVLADDLQRYRVQRHKVEQVELDGGGA
ncbi:MAG: MBL fold metallo-hydrolase [Anaerolineae bacterium]